MANLANITPLNSSHCLIDPTGFDVTIIAVLTNAGAQKYIEIFRKNNIGQNTLTELTDEDLFKFGVVEAEIRRNIITAVVKHLPLSSEITTYSSLTIKEVTGILEDTTEHLSKIYLSLAASRLALKKAKTTDHLLYRDQYASDVAITTLNELTHIINSMENTINTKMKGLMREQYSKKSKKYLVGAVGGAIIVTLTVLFIRSLKQLK